MTPSEEKVREVLRQIRKFAPDEDWADVIEAAMKKSPQREALLQIPIERCSCGKCQTGHLVFDDEMHGFLDQTWMWALDCSGLRPGERKVVTLRAMLAAEARK